MFIQYIHIIFLKLKLFNIIRKISKGQISRRQTERDQKNVE